MIYERFVKRVEKGDRVKVTDTFLVNRPSWDGKVVEKASDRAITVKWDDKHEDSIFAPAFVTDSDDFEIIK